MFLLWSGKEVLKFCLLLLLPQYPGKELPSLSSQPLAHTMLTTDQCIYNRHLFQKTGPLLLFHINPMNMANISKFCYRESSFHLHLLSAYGHQLCCNTSLKNVFNKRPNVMVVCTKSRTYSARHQTGDGEGLISRRTTSDVETKLQMGIVLHRQRVRDVLSISPSFSMVHHWPDQTLIRRCFS